MNSPADHRRDLGLVALGGFLFFLYRYGWSFLDPTRTDWLLGRADAAMNFFGWGFLRQAAWTFPAGAIPAYDWPGGTSIALTDSIPLLALPLRLLSPVLPPDFHYFGFWLVACHILQVAFAWAIARRFSDDRRVQMAGALLGLFTPVWLHRIGHMALAGQWILLAAWWLYLRDPVRSGLAPRAGRWTGLFAIVALVHPYLWAMTSGIALAGWLRSWRRGRLNAPKVAVLVLLALLVSGLMWWTSGMFVLDDPSAWAAEGLGTYSMNLNGPVNSSATSNWVGPLPLHFMGQYEGYAYLGLPVLALLAVVVCGRLLGGTLVRSILDHREAVALVLVAVFVALGPVWTLGDRVLLDGFWPQWMRSGLEPFRATGRFAWILVYAVFVAVLAGTARMRAARWVLPLAALVALVEMRPIERVDLYLADKLFEPRADLDALERYVPEGGVVVLVPPHARSLVHRDDWREWGLICLRKNARLGGGYLTRIDESARERLLDRARTALEKGEPEPGVLYVLGDAASRELVVPAGALEVEGYTLVGAR